MAVPAARLETRAYSEPLLRRNRGGCDRLAARVQRRDDLLDEGADEIGVELGAGTLPQLLQSLLPAHRRAVGAAFGHRVVGIADEDRPRAEGDIAAGEIV